MKHFIAGIVFTVAAMAAAACWLTVSGYIDFRADQPASAIESSIAMRAVDAWSDRHAGGASNPLPATDENITAGTTLYLNHCAGCHGLPANPNSTFQQSFYPPAPGFFRQMPAMEDSANFYVIKHGIRWTGMPAWGQTLGDEQIWQIMLLFENMHKLPPDARKILEPAPASVAREK